MKTNDILELDFLNDRDRSERVMSKALHTIKPFTKYEGKVPMEALEQLVFLMQKKYRVAVFWVLMSHEDDMPIYTMTFRHGSEIGDMSYIVGTVHGITLYEVFAKACVLLWANKAKFKKV